MLPELERLIELQELDHSIVRKLREIQEEIPSKISEIEAQLKALQRDFQNSLNQITEFEKKKKSKERELQDTEEKIKRLKSRSAEIKTNKEYQALLKEIEAAEKEKYHIEDEILNLMERAEEIKKELSTREAIFKDKQSELELKKKEFLSLKEKAEKELGLLKEERARLVDHIPPSQYELYMLLLEKGRGMAVVKAVESVCQGCYLRLPPQLFVEIKRNESLIQCPQCKRILYCSESPEVETPKSGVARG